MSVSRHLFATLLMLAATLLATNPAQAAREVSANRECATCHIMWLTEFNQSEARPLIKYDPTPTEPSGKQDIASTERMCFSCHDGFVLDSRFMWKQGGHSHPVGVVPSDKVRIPTAKGKKIFPLNSDGKLYCGSCHSAHGIDWKEKESPIFLREKNINSSLCIACHLNRSTGPQHGNHPIFKSLPSYPESLKSKGARFTKANEVICQSCHKPHAAENTKILITDNTDSHLCLSCHTEKQSLLPSKHNMANTATELANAQGHTTAQSGPCSSCHLPHNGNGPTLWARQVDSSLPDPASSTCLSCHADKQIVNGKTVGTHSHPVGRSVKRLGIEVDKGTWRSPRHNLGPQAAPLPLFDKDGERSAQGTFISCASCHDPHTWSQDHASKAQTTSKADQEGDGQNSFLRIPGGVNSPLCMTCHLDKREIIRSKHNLNRPQRAVILATQAGVEAGSKPDALATLAEVKPTPLCSHCHTPHNAKGGSLRARGDNPKQAPLESLCRDCHQKEGLAGDKAVDAHSHPLGVRPAEGANTTRLPLFDHDGARDPKGKLDCATCHDPHRWSATTSMSTDDTEGDGRNSFLRLHTAGDSALCQQCHTKQAKVINTDHDLSVSAPAATNALGQTVEQSGPCAQCHALHNPLMPEKLWARNAGQGEHPIEQQCRSCHQKDGPASNKVPPALQHPKRVTVWSAQARRIYKEHPIPNIPVFDAEAKSSASGSITCASCHDPHTWSVDPAKQKGLGKTLEGDAMSSFLRNNSSAYIVCADCHGEDAIYRYKYFHSEASRVKHPLYK